MSQPAAPDIEVLLSRYPALEPCRADIGRARDAFIATYENSGKVLLCGNGGSAADCEHIAGELLKGFERARPLPTELHSALAQQGPEGERLAEQLHAALPAIALTGHPSFASAWANDADPELVFAQLVTALGRPGDVMLAISTSGGARNVALAVRAAVAAGLTTIGLSGKDGGALPRLCDVLIIVAGETTAEIQELHLPVYHYLCRSVEAHFFPG